VSTRSITAIIAIHPDLESASRPKRSGWVITPSALACLILFAILWRQPQTLVQYYDKYFLPNKYQVKTFL
jgi:hypothetical protein